MIYLLYFSILYLIIASVILLRNRVDFTPLLSANPDRFTADSPMASICIPARNEESVLKRCVESAIYQDYPNFEVLVLDDESTDQTPVILDKLQHQYTGRLRALKGRPKPQHWLGKPWACRQLAEAASGDILIFIDADTWLESDAISRIVKTMGHDIVDFLTVWPRQQLHTFWEKMLIPMVYYALLSLLPARYVYRRPRWIPEFIWKRCSPVFAAACGQFMAFKKEAYWAVGGHEAVKNRIVEDVKMAKIIKKEGFKMKMYYGNGSVFCRMYTSEEEIREGFRKNFLAGFNKNIALFVLVGIVQFVVYILPWLTLAGGIVAGQSALALYSAAAIILILLHRLLLDRWMGWNPLYGILHPVSVLWYQRLGWICLKDYYRGTQITWKDRKVSVNS